MNKVIFQYKPETTAAILLRHHRIARWIIYPCGFFSLLMLSSVAHGVLFRFDTITTLLLIVSVCAVTLLVIPACFSVPWIWDIEVELIKRGEAIPGGQDINRRIATTAGKMMLWAFAISAGPVVIREFLHLIGQQC